MRVPTVIYTVLAICSLAPALAHGPADWIQRGGFRNTAGDLCCGERDCRQLDPEDVRYVPQRNGYAIFDRDTRDQDKREPIDFVPESETLPSPDGGYWRCQWGGMRRCFFAPPPNS